METDLRYERRDLGPAPNAHPPEDVLDLVGDRAGREHESLRNPVVAQSECDDCGDVSVPVVRSNRRAC
jgi:hypothetical protein